MKKFKLVLMYKNQKLEVDAFEFVVNTENGQLTILKDHIPFITTIKEGNSCVICENQKINLYVYDGILNVDRDMVYAFCKYDDKISK